MLGAPAHERESAERQEKQKLKNVLKQAISRNKAHEKQDLWKQKDQEDKGSKFALSLKSNTGRVRTVAVVPQGARVSDNSVNVFEEERRRQQDKKEDKLLDRLCDGKDSAWRPDSFFETLDHDVPWLMRPSDFFANPNAVERVVCAYEASKSASKKDKKEKKEKEKDKKSKKKEKRKKDKKEKKRKKKEKEKEKKSKRLKSEEARNSDSSANENEATPIAIICDSSEEAAESSPAAAEYEGSQEAVESEFDCSQEAAESEYECSQEAAESSPAAVECEGSEEAAASCGSSSFADDAPST